MGMFDTIYFDQKYACPLCGKEICDIQTKEFENLLNYYHVKDCISHAEDIEIIKDELFCNACSKHTGSYVYIIVARGILLGTTDTLKAAKELLNDLNLEKMILWYHDLYKRYVIEEKKPLEDVVKQLSEEDLKETVKFIESRKDRRVFYYEGLYGSLVPDIENDRLVGKIEGISRDIVYEGKTVGECENKFRDAVSVYLKT